MCDSCKGFFKRCDWCTCLDSVAFTQKILDDTFSKLCIDKNKIFATGFSNGAMMAYEIALRKSDVFAAVAPAEGSVHVSYYDKIDKN